MKYSEVISEILTRADEAFVGESEDRARVYFRSSLALLIKKGEYLNSDVLKLQDVLVATVSGDDLSYETIANTACTGKYISEVRDVYADPACTSGVGRLITRTTTSKVKRYSFAPGLMPGGTRVEFIPTGSSLRFFSKNLSGLVGKELRFDVILSPPEYKPSACGIVWSWNDESNMEEWFSYGFLITAIEFAAAMFKEEVQGQ